MLMFDAVQTFLRAMEGVSYGNSLQLSTDHVTCDSESSLEIGSTIYNYLNAVSFHYKHINAYNIMRLLLLCYYMLMVFTVLNSLFMVCCNCSQIQSTFWQGSTVFLIAKTPSRKSELIAKFAKYVCEILKSCCSMKEYVQWCWGVPMEPKSVGVRVSGVKIIFTGCYGFEHFLTSTTPINPRTII